MNETLESNPATLIINRLFTLMKDRAIQYQGIRRRTVIGNYNAGRSRIHDFMIWATNYGSPGEAAIERMIRQLDKIGLRNAALYLYQEPIVCPDGDPERLPEAMRLKCVIRNGELFPIPADRQICPVTDIYNRDELPVEKLGYFSYPLFCGKYLFGLLVCGAEGQMYAVGEFMMFQLSRAICMNWVTPETNNDEA